MSIKYAPLLMKSYGYWLLMLILASVCPYIFMQSQNALFPLYIIIFALLVIISYHNHIATAALFILAEIAVNTFEFKQSVINMGPISLSLIDILSFVLLFVIIIRFAKSGLSILSLNNNLSWLFLIFTVLVFIGFIRGISTYRYSDVGGGARSYIYFTLICFYIKTTRLNDVKITRLYKTFIVLACILLLIGVFRISEKLTFVVSKEFRVLNSFQTLFLTFILISIIILQIDSKIRSLAMRISSFILMNFIIFLQIRSVWIALSIGIISLLFIYRTKLNRFTFSYTLLLISLVSFINIVFPQIYTKWSSYLYTSLTDLFHLFGYKVYDNTAVWRLKGWILMLKDLTSIQNWLFGKGFGYHFEIDEWGKGQGYVGAHSIYIGTITRMGILGMSVFLIFVHKLEKRIYIIMRETKDDFTYNIMAILFTCILATMGYMVAYGFDIYIGILFGIAMSYVISYEENLRLKREE